MQTALDLARDIIESVIEKQAVNRALTVGAGIEHVVIDLGAVETAAFDDLNGFAMVTQCAQPHITYQALVA